MQSLILKRTLHTEENKSKSDCSKPNFEFNHRQYQLGKACVFSTNSLVCKSNLSIPSPTLREKVAYLFAPRKKKLEMLLFLRFELIYSHTRYISMVQLLKLQYVSIFKKKIVLMKIIYVPGSYPDESSVPLD